MSTLPRPVSTGVPQRSPVRTGVMVTIVLLLLWGAYSVFSHAAPLVREVEVVCHLTGERLATGEPLAGCAWREPGFAGNEYPQHDYLERGRWQTFDELALTGRQDFSCKGWINEERRWSYGSLYGRGRWRSPEIARCHP